MRAYICPECHDVLVVGSDGLEVNAAQHVARDGATHHGAELVELPGHDHADGVAWHAGRGPTHVDELRAAFPAPPEPEAERETPALGTALPLDEAVVADADGSPADATPVEPS